MRRTAILVMALLGTAALLAVACGGGDGASNGGDGTLPTIPADRERLLAPIESAEVLILESFPPQYRLAVTAGLPGGCAQPAGFTVVRAGDGFTVEVFNSLPRGDVACTAIYGMYDLSIALANDLASGKEYDVEVNGTRLSFTAQ